MGSRPGARLLARPAGLSRRRNTCGAAPRTRRIQQPLQVAAAKVEEMARHVHAVPGAAQQAELPARGVGHLHDQPAVGRQQSRAPRRGRRADRGRCSSTWNMVIAAKPPARSGACSRSRAHRRHAAAGATRWPRPAARNPGPPREIRARASSPGTARRRSPRRAAGPARPIARARSTKRTWSRNTSRR